MSPKEKNQIRYNINGLVEVSSPVNQDLEARSIRRKRLAKLAGVAVGTVTLLSVGEAAAGKSAEQIDRSFIAEQVEIPEQNEAKTPNGPIDQAELDRIKEKYRTMPVEQQINTNTPEK